MEPVADATLGVYSEVGTLRQVIVHRPGLELSRLSPDNVKDLLFDDVVWAERARQEHDAFVAALEAQGVVVHHFGRLLAETLEIAAGRAFVLDRLCTPEMVGPSNVDGLRRIADGTDSATLAEYLIGGIVKADLSPRHPAPAHRQRMAVEGGDHVHGLSWDVLGDDDFVLPPLPNHLFQRDNAAWIYGGVSINPMALPARKRESIHSRAVYRYDSDPHVAIRQHSVPGEASASRSHRAVSRRSSFASNSALSCSWILNCRCRAKNRTCGWPHFRRSTTIKPPQNRRESRSRSVRRA